MTLRTWLVLLALLAGCASSPPLEVMTYNVRYGTANDGENAWSEREQLALDVVRDHRPDAVGMQELLDFQREAFLQANPGYAAIGEGRGADGGGEQCAILYRQERLELVESGQFWLSETPEVPGSKSWDSSLPRICTWVLLRDRESGQRFHLFNTHFDHRGEQARLEAARLIVERIEQRQPRGPAILIGDLNAVPDSAPLAALASLTDAWRSVRPGEPEQGTFHGFRGGTDGRRIDYVLVTAGVEVEQAQILSDGTDGRFPSDHHPVLARLRLP